MEEQGWFSPGFGGMEEGGGNGEDGDFRRAMHAIVSVARGLGPTVQETLSVWGGSAVGADGGYGGGLAEQVYPERNPATGWRAMGEGQGWRRKMEV